jgi:SHS2 domain-containing protein
MALMDEIIKQIAANQSSDEIKNLITSNLFKFTQDVASTPRVQSRVDSVQRTESQATNTDQDVNIEDVQSERETAVVFSIQDIHDIAEHILNDVIRHHSLYNFVFNYEQIEDVQRYELLVDTSASVIPLKSMQTKEAYDAAILKAQEDKEQQERDKIANEERLRFEREQAQLVHEEAVKADVDFGPQLSEDLLGIAEWLRANVQADFDVKKDDLISKLNVLLETVDPTADKKDKKKPPVVKK